jgi:hypothetical protein
MKMSKLNPTVLIGLLTVITSTQFVSSAQAATEVISNSGNIFVLGGEALPNSIEISQGDLNVADKEQKYLASIGIDLGSEPSERPRTSSKNGSGGYSDSDIM